MPDVTTEDILECLKTAIWEDLEQKQWFGKYSVFYDEGKLWRLDPDGTIREMQAATTAKGSKHTPPPFKAPTSQEHATIPKEKAGSQGPIVPSAPEPKASPIKGKMENPQPGGQSKQGSGTQSKPDPGSQPKAEAKPAAQPSSEPKKTHRFPRGVQKKEDS